MFHALAVGSMLLSSLTAPTSVALSPESALSPDKITIDVVSANGSGCPGNSQDAAVVAVSPDATAFTVTYSNYLAQVGPGLNITEARKNCQLGLNVHIPQGFTYAIAEADYRGFGSLAKGASASERASYYFQGNPQTVRITHTFKGPLESDWQTSDKVGIEALVYLPCGEERNLNLNTELRVSKGSSDSNKTSYLMMDSTDGDINTVYRLAWKSCKK